MDLISQQKRLHDYHDYRGAIDDNCGQIGAIVLITIILNNDANKERKHMTKVKQFARFLVVLLRFRHKDRVDRVANGCNFLEVNTQPAALLQKSMNGSNIFQFIELISLNGLSLFEIRAIERLLDEPLKDMRPEVQNAVGNEVKLTIVIVFCIHVVKILVLVLFVN